MSESKDPKTPQEEYGEDAAPAFLSFNTLKVAQVNMINGLLSGYNIGFVAPYTALYEISENCAAFYAPDSCNTLANTNCVFGPANEAAETSTCLWKGKPLCFEQTTSGGCTAISGCTWDYSKSTCSNTHGYNATQKGVFAGAMILGEVLGSLFGGYFITFFGLKRTFLIVGLCSVICSVLIHISTNFNIFGLLCAARVVIGIFIALVCNAAPMYVNMHAHPKNCKAIGVLFQVFNTLGICFAATMGLIVGQTVQYHKNMDQQMKGRMQGLCGGATLFALLVVFLGIFLEDTKIEKREGDDAEKDEAQRLDINEYSWGSMVVPLLLGAIVSGTLQLTGINAIMNYAPTMMESLGMDPLLGNFVVMVVNFVTTIASIPLAKYFTMRQMFLGGSVVTSVVCLFLCGIPVYPGVASTDAKNGVAITGIIVYIAAFEIGVGPCFYVLAQDLFPPSFRPKGASFTMVIQFLLNLLINVLYPIATTNISGGASGNQDKGQSIAFIFFGCIGLICFVVEIFHLFPWEGKTSTGELEIDDGKVENDPIPEDYRDDA